MTTSRQLSLICCTAGLFVAAGFATPGMAQDDFSQVAENAKAAFKPLDEADLDAARTELARRVIDAEQLLRGTRNQGADWMEYLQWDGIQKQLNADSEPDLAAARETLRLLGSGVEGLEKPSLQAVGDALENYISIASFAPAPPERQQRSFELAVDGLVELLADEDRLESARGSYEAERRLAILAGLESKEGGLSFTDEVRNRYGRPNLIVEVEESFLNRLAARPVADRAPVSDVILGTRIRGTGLTCGQVQVSTLPSHDRAKLLFQLSGTTRTNTVGVNGPVSIRSTGNTRFNASKVVELDDRTFRVLPASAAATTRTQTQDVNKIGGGLGSRIVESIARKRVAQSKSQAEAIASNRAEARIEARLNEQLDQEIVDARRRYDKAITKPLRRRRATPRYLAQRTTSGSLLIEAVQADEGQLAAEDTPPAAVTAPLSARVHQTAVDNLLDSYLGGATLRRDSVDEATQINIAKPSWLKLKAKEPEEGTEFKPWILTLRDRRPISVEFTGGRIKAIIHADRIEVGDKNYDDWDLIAEYTPSIVEGEWRLIREGEIDVFPSRFNPARDKNLTSAEVGLRNNLAKALNDQEAFPESVKIDPIDLTERPGPIDFLSLRGLSIDGGWLAIGWQAL